MHQHNENTHQHNAVPAPFILRHLLLLAFAISVAVVLYTAFRDVKLSTLGIILVVLAHIVAVVGIGWIGRNSLGGLIQKFHGVSEPMHPHSHDETIETEGATISWARLYDVFVQFILMGEYRKMMTSTVKLANIQPNEKILDVGCGTGTLAIQAKEASHPSVVIQGLDAAPEMIARAQKKAHDKGVNVEFRQGVIEAIQAADGTYDLVMNSLMVHHLPPELKVKGFAEIYRVLKTGGRLLIVDFEPPKQGLLRGFLRFFVGDGMMQIDNSTIIPLLESAGFTQIEKGQTDSRMATYISAKKSA